MVMTRLPAYHPGNFLMKNMNPPNSGLMYVVCTCIVFFVYPGMEERLNQMSEFKQIN